MLSTHSHFKTRFFYPEYLGIKVQNMKMNFNNGMKALGIMWAKNIINEK